MLCYCINQKQEKDEDTIKILTGQRSLIQQKIEEEIIDNGDIIITSDTDEIVFINKQGEQHLIKAETPNQVFNSTEEALVWIDSSQDYLYEGKMFIIYDEESQLFKIYILQKEPEKREDNEDEIEAVSEESSEPIEPTDPELPSLVLIEYDIDFKILAYDAIEKRHEHENKEILDTFTKEESEIMQEIINVEQSVLEKTQEYIEKRLSELIIGGKIVQ